MMKLLPLVIKYLRYYFYHDYDGVWKNTLQRGGRRLLNLKLYPENYKAANKFSNMFSFYGEVLFLNNKSSRLLRYTPREIPFEGEEQIKIEKVFWPE